MVLRTASIALCLSLVLAACASEPVEELGTIAQALKSSAVKPIAKVSVTVGGTARSLDVETQYLPKVVCCENGAAHPEALKAQAVLARTYMYFQYFESGNGTPGKPLTGTQSDQVYNCTTPVSQKCTDAVVATKNQITTFERASVSYHNVSFFVDGRRPACIARGSCSCPKPSATTSMTPANHPADCACFTLSSNGLAPHETYNWNKSGTAVSPVGAPMGNPGHESNRGCAGQNVQNCLGYAGWNYFDMLRMFYGQDIQVRVAGGALVPEPGTVVVPPTGQTYAYEVVEATLPLLVKEDEPGTVRIMLKNVGSVAWEQGKKLNVRLIDPKELTWKLSPGAALPKDAPAPSGDQFPVSGTVAPGETFRIDAEVRALTKRKDPGAMALVFALAESDKVVAGPSTYSIPVCDSKDPKCSTSDVVAPAPPAEDENSGCSVGRARTGHSSLIAFAWIALYSRRRKYQSRRRSG
jgi:hypothetical protein